MKVTQHHGENMGQGDCKDWEGLGQVGARGVSNAVSKSEVCTLCQSLIGQVFSRAM
jgi:hypothetical protein